MSHTSGSTGGLGGPVPPATRVEAARTAVIPDDARTATRNTAAWGAILAGIVTMLAVQLLLNILGVGLGAATLDVGNAANNPSATTAAVTPLVWIVVSGIVASFAGGLVAGRLCGSSRRGTGSWHGFVAWAATTLVIFYLLSTALGAVLGGAGSLVSGVAGGAGRAVSGAASAAPGLAQAADPTGQLTGNLQGQVRDALGQGDPQAVRDSIVSFIRSTATGDQAGQQAARDRAVDAMARTANITPDEARARLGQLEAQYRDAAAKAEDAARRAAETAREGAKTAGIAGFVALLLGAVAAWLGGAAGTPRREAVAVRA